MDWNQRRRFDPGPQRELTNTRYIVGAAPLLPLLSELDPEMGRFEPRMLFELYQDPQGGPILIRTNSTGPFGLIEFTGALPRAKLFTDWQTAPFNTGRIHGWLSEKRKRLPSTMTSAFSMVASNDLATLERLTDKSFDPHRTVLLSETLASAPTNAAPGTVQYLAYSPKRILFKTTASSPSVLLLNDKYDPN